MTLQELIDRAIMGASAGIEPSLSPTLNADAIAEDLLPLVFGRVGDRAAEDERLRHTLRRVKTLNVATGLVTLSSDTLSAYIWDSVLIDPADTSKRYSYLPWESMVRDSLDPRIGHYSIEGESRLRVVEPGDTYDPTTGPTIALRLAIPCAPEIPAAPGDDIAVTDEVVDMLLEELITALRPILREAKR